MTAATALECDFPLIEISRIAEQESWRKEINRPLYHIHKWWATRLGSVFRGIALGALSPPETDIWKKFYQTHNFDGKVVLDPFMGSGTTLGEAVKLGAKAIGCDINPVSTFAVRQLFAPVTKAQLHAAFAELEHEVAPQIRHYHQTRDPESGEKIPVLYYFWVKTVSTPKGEIIPLLSRHVFAQDAYPQKKPRAQIVCPACWNIMEERYDALHVRCPHCAHSFNPQQGPAAGQYVTDSDGQRHKIKTLLSRDKPPAHRMYAIMALRADGTKVYLPVCAEDLQLYEQARQRLAAETLPLPEMMVRAGHNTNQARGYNYTHWRDFFNARQLLCLGLLLRAIMQIGNPTVQEQMLCLFSGTLEFNNMFCSFKGEGTGAVRHMFSHHILKPERMPLENSVWGTEKSSGTFSTLFESRLLRARDYLDAPFEIALDYDLFGHRAGVRKTVASLPICARRFDDWAGLNAANAGVMILNGNSATLPLPEKSVDAVISDPPYFDFVHYSELSDFFFSWLSPVLRTRHTWMARADSSAQGEVQHQDARIFARKLTLVFAESCRVLKDDGVLAFSFHHSRPEGWAAIYEALEQAGLAAVAAHPVHAELRAASSKNAAKAPISLDAILVCRKKAFAEKPQVCVRNLAQTIAAVSSRLRAAGFCLSRGDDFVIAAAYSMIAHAPHGLDFNQIKCELESLYADIFLAKNSLQLEEKASADHGRTSNAR